MSLILKGNGYYNATLIISPVEREDTDRDIELRARNSEGERIYNIKISTLGEPEGKILHYYKFYL